ncbi:hypothetical protein [Bradyrhizobium sp. STM 3562]|uniref:hypothetical protein n=1 Tax=Bradyrhizobium sp. STM 3562 TaxID=578924 RepID=UPI00388D1A16
MVHCVLCVASIDRGVAVESIVEAVVDCFGGSISRPTQQKLLSYLHLLASTGKTDEQLLAFGIAYVRELLEPNPRYSGW